MKVLGPVVLFLISIHKGSSIRCYDCNSANNSMCLDPTLYDKESLARYLAVTDCDNGVFSHGQQKYFCRKIIQKILHKNHDTEVRVTRGCGWVLHKRDCYKADNEDHLETVCQCFTDDCNAGIDLRYSLATLLTVFTVFTLI